MRGIDDILQSILRFKDFVILRRAQERDELLSNAKLGAGSGRGVTVHVELAVGRLAWPEDTRPPVMLLWLVLSTPPRCMFESSMV